MIDLKLPALIICGLLLAYLLWQEYRRPNTKRRLLRMLASVLALASLALLFVPLLLGKKQLGRNEAVWLTPGYSKDSLARFRGLPLFTTDPLIAQKSGATLIASAGDIALQKGGIRQVNILGHGPAPGELEAAGTLKLAFHPDTPKEGFAAANWPKRMVSGQAFTVQGQYLNPGSKPVKLVLKGLGTSLDSVSLNKGTTNFSLTSVPRQSGRSLFSLLAIRGRDTLSKDDLPVLIQPEQKPAILVLSSSPDFENRFLKEWLGQQAYPVAVRSRSSKERSAVEYFNQERINLDVLTEQVLAKFDLLILDQDELKLLRPAELNALQRQVRSGLGLLLRADSSYRGSLVNFGTQKFNGKSLNINVNTAKALSALSADNPSVLSAMPGSQPVAYANTQYLVAAVQLRGAGRLGITTLKDSFQWLLSGQKPDYAAFWSALISRTARAAESGPRWEVSPALPVPGERLSIALYSGSITPQPITVNNTGLSPEQGQLNPTSWKGFYWASSPGWQELSSGTEQSEFYVFYPSQWQSLRALQRIESTRRSVQQHQASGSSQSSTEAPLKVPVSKWFFFAFFPRASSNTSIKRINSTGLLFPIL